MSKLNIAAYAEGCMYPGTKNTQIVEKTIEQMQSSGLTTVILSLFHIGRNSNIGVYQNPGDIYFNNTLVFSNGEFTGYRGYVNDKSWPELVASIKGGSVDTVCASIGGGGVFDFTTIAEIYQNNGSSFSNTNLEKNFKKMKAVLPDITIIDMDNEDDWSDIDSFLAFCRMLIGIGYGITFCPYCEPSFWNTVLTSLNDTNPGAVKWWNLQCYDGGAQYRNLKEFDSDWATSTPGFILIGDWIDDVPSDVQTLMNTFKNESCVGGGFIWTIDQIIQQSPEDPTVSMKAYIDAISVGLGNKI